MGISNGDGMVKNDRDTELKEIFRDMRGILLEILRWSRLQGMQQLKAVSSETFQRDVEKIIYHNSDGRDSREIANLAGVSHGTVVNYWKKWASLGLVEPIRVRGGERYRRVFSLPEFGIELQKNKVVEPGETRRGRRKG